MSQAEELLNGLSDEEVASYTALPDVEPHIVIGSNRIISVPDTLKKLAVQYDHDVETVTFDCPRYWDGHDMSTWRVLINYTRSDGYKDAYVATNITVEEDLIHFDWTISSNVTEAVGSIEFNVCIKNVDSDGYEVNHWNTEICSAMTVAKGMENTVHAINNQPDLIQSIANDVTAKVEDDMAEVLASLNEYAESLVGGES